MAAGLSGAFARTNGSLRTFKPCGPGAPMLASRATRLGALSRIRRGFASRGGGKKAGPRGEHGADVKPIARGRPALPAELVVPAACIF